MDVKHDLDSAAAQLVQILDLRQVARPIQVKRIVGHIKLLDEAFGIAKRRLREEHNRARFRVAPAARASEAEVEQKRRALLAAGLPLEHVDAAIAAATQRRKLDAPLARAQRALDRYAAAEHELREAEAAFDADGNQQTGRDLALKDAIANFALVEVLRAHAELGAEVQFTMPADRLARIPLWAYASMDKRHDTGLLQIATKTMQLLGFSDDEIRDVLAREFDHDDRSHQDRLLGRRGKRRAGRPLVN